MLATSYKLEDTQVPKITDAEVLTRAKVLCEKDGHFWEALPGPRTFSAYLHRYVITNSDCGRYLEHARQQLE